MAGKRCTAHASIIDLDGGGRLWRAAMPRADCFVD
jgi:hypothetical protein